MVGKGRQFFDLTGLGELPRIGDVREDQVHGLGTDARRLCQILEAAVEELDVTIAQGLN